MLDEQQHGTDETYEELSIPEKPVPAHAGRPRRPWLKLLEQGLAALLGLAIILGWLALSRLPHASTAAPFNDAEARPL